MVGGNKYNAVWAASTSNNTHTCLHTYISAFTYGNTHHATLILYQLNISWQRSYLMRAVIQCISRVACVMYDDEHRSV